MRQGGQKMGKKKKKRYLARRILAMILAMTMVVGMTPTAVQAAPGEGAEQVVAEAAASEGQNDDGTGQPSETGNQPAQDGGQSDTTEETAPADSDNVGNQNDSPEQGTADDGSNDGTAAEDTEAAVGENQDEGADDTAVSSPMADAAETQAKPVYEIDIKAFETQAEYTGYSVFELGNITLVKTENGVTTSESAMDAGVTAVWKVQGTDAAVAGEPVNAGKYELTLTYPKAEGTHDGAEKKVECEITKAPVEFRFESERVYVKPGTAAKDVKPGALNRVYCAGNNLDAEDFDLKATAVKNAMTGEEIPAEEKLLHGGDYAMQITPSIKADAAQAKKDISANYDLAPFIVDIETGELVDTYIEITLAEKWKENGIVTLKSYDGKAATEPKTPDDYTAVVKYWDEAANDYKKLEGAAITGQWVTGWDAEEISEMEAPADAGGYFYRLRYEGVEGEYQAASGVVEVEIKPAAVKIQIRDADKKLVLPQGTTMSEVVTRADYAAVDEAGKDITGEVKKKQIWGTSYDDSNMSQVYEPLLTLEVKDGTGFKAVLDADYELEGGKEYRIVFDGQKAIYNADGTFGHRTSINEDRNINGYDYNYETDNTRTADAQARAVEVTAATRAVIDVSELVKDDNAATLDQIATLKSKVYDGREIYSARSQYKNKVGLKTADDKGTKIKTLAKEFSYEWQKNDAAENLQDKENLENEDNWSPVYGFTISPDRAGIYRLKITYQDMTEDGTLYYADNSEYVYYAIDRQKVKIVPNKEKSYETLSGRSVGSFFDDNEIDCSILDAETEKALTFPKGHHAEVTWQMQETVGEKINTYLQYDYGYTFVSDAGTAYAIQAAGLEVYTLDNDGYEDFSDNYTVASADTVPLTVKPMGTVPVKLEVDASKWGSKTKVYDGKPFAQNELITDGVVTAKKVENGAETTIEDPGISYITYDPNEGETRSLDWTTDAGVYELYACFDGSTAYAPIENPDSFIMNGVKIGIFEITQREITLKIDNMPKTYEAGILVSDILRDIPGKVRVEGFAPGQEWAFTEDDGIPAWDHASPVFEIYEKGSKTPVDEYTSLKWDQSFVVRYAFWSDGLSEGYYTEEFGEINFRRNYKVSADVAAAFDTVKGNSHIESVSYEGISEIAVVSKMDEKDPMRQEVTVLDGIGYSRGEFYDGYDDIIMEGNLAAFDIAPPAYYGDSVPETAMFRNEIKQQKGIAEIYDDKIRVVFNAAEGTKTFRIRWEDDYVETYVLKFDEAVKLGNLEEAVAPKSLAFNAVEKKMAVGESQQLDVKITKAQMGDIIKLGYKSSDESVLKVNENGYVTALKEGKANIEVFPVRLVKGKLERIKDAKGVDAKGATVAVAVTKLSAPKPVKVTSHGSYADVNYDIPKDGYRREIYVVDNGKNPDLKTAAAIEGKVASMKEGQWKSTFAIKPVYQDSTDEYYNNKKNKYTVRLNGLETRGAYTVYVRNVCAARELADGSMITKETVDASAAGTAVSFKTLKSEAVELGLDFDVPEDARGYDEEGLYRIMWFSKLEKATVTCVPYGYFRQDETDHAADEGDRIRLALPFAGEDKKYKDYYEEPKLEYALKFASEDEDAFAAKNKAASIDKKGKIKFTGIPTDDNPLEIRVRDAVSGVEIYGYVSFRDGADSVVAAKGSVKMSVGQRKKLADLLTYKFGGTKLTYYPSGSVDLDAVQSAITSQKQESFFKVNENGYLTAVKAGGALTLALTDKNVAKIDKDKATATVKVTSADLEPVKSLKAYDVIDDSFGLTFTHTGGAERFLVEISDNNRLIYSRGYIASEHRMQTEDGEIVKDAYRIRPEEIIARLNRESAYTVSVKAQYDTVASKAVSAKVKTTKIPAVSTYIGDDEYIDTDPKIPRRGGMEIQVSEDDSGTVLCDYNTALQVLSGNAYTLTAKVDSNRGRVSDTLVWTLGDAKVANVKAAAGTYCVTLKGLKPGSTVLEVKSKIWGNKVIARYDIHVVAVGNAYDYYGDNEKSGYGEPSIDNGGSSAPAYLPLGVDDRRKVTVGQTAYFHFQAPETGRYRFSGTGNVFGGIILGKGEEYDKPSPSQSSSLDLGLMKAGERICLSSRANEWPYRPGDVSYYVEVTMTQSEAEIVEKVSAVGDTTVTNYEGEKIFEFTAPESADYEFSFMNTRYGNWEFFYLYTSRDAALEDGYNYDDAGTTMNRTLAQGESVWLKTQNLRSNYSYTFSVQKRETPVDPELSLDTPKDVKVAAGESQELTFTVADEGLYTFSSTAGANYRLAPRAAGDSDVLVTLKVNGAVKYSENGSVFEIQVYLQAGDMVSLTMVNNGSTVSALTVTARQTEFTVTEVTTDTDVSVENGGLYKFTAGTEGNYEFFLSPLSDDMETYEVHLYGSEADAYNGENVIVDAEVWQNLAEYRMSADETVWISTKLSGTAGGNLTIAKMDQKMTLDTPIAVSVPTGERHRYLTYQVSQDGNYKFATVTGGLSDMEGCVTITVNGEEVFLQNSVAVIDFDFRWVLQQGDTVCIEITSGFGENDMEVTVKAEEFTIPDLSEEEITLEKGKRNAAYKYTVTKDGTYQIRMESNLNDMNLLCYDRLSDLFQENMDSAIGSDTGVSSEGGNKYSCTTDKLVLTTGQIVYINPRNGNDSADMQATITVSNTQEPSPEPEPEQPTDPTEPEEPENP